MSNESMNNLTRQAIETRLRVTLNLVRVYGRARNSMMGCPSTIPHDLRRIDAKLLRALGDYSRALRMERRNAA